MHGVLILIGVINLLAAVLAPPVCLAAVVNHRPSLLTALGDSDPTEFTEQERAVLLAAQAPLVELSKVLVWGLGIQGIALIAIGGTGIVRERRQRSPASVQLAQ